MIKSLLEMEVQFDQAPDLGVSDDGLENSSRRRCDPFGHV
jgi:hypothetical protein